jgi:hypothetical protein
MSITFLDSPLIHLRFDFICFLWAFFTAHGRDILLPMKILLFPWKKQAGEVGIYH